MENLNGVFVISPYYPFWALQRRPCHSFAETLVPRRVLIIKTHQPSFTTAIITSLPLRTTSPPIYCITNSAWRTNISTSHNHVWQYHFVSVSRCGGGEFFSSGHVGEAIWTSLALFEVMTVWICLANNVLPYGQAVLVIWTWFVFFWMKKEWMRTPRILMAIQLSCGQAGIWKLFMPCWITTEQIWVSRGKVEAALIWASWKGHLEVIKALLHHGGVDVNIKS